ncbi:MAG: NAD(+)/NADH kinase [Thermoanaerobaculum sp.]|nr:NAD(+)/NADH kinase [Thermoanaerobaculum sp.]MDW7968023.1 NAD(+)/NADH kinase [Thermoanaerobaculum sp.]
MADNFLRLPPKKLGLVVKTSSPEAIALGRQVLGKVRSLGMEVVVDAQSAPHLETPSGPPRGELGSQVDVVLVLGGDGTFLSAARGCPPTTPVAGVNLGTLGFLTEHPAEQLWELVAALATGDVHCERRDRLLCLVEGGGGPQRFLVLNDVVIAKGTLARILVIDVEVEGEFLSRYRADGLILASPTGSTAYNLSAGGPIVHPLLPALIITPICSHTLSNRPLVVPLSFRVAVRVHPGDEDVFLTLDGQYGMPLDERHVVRILPEGDPLWVVRPRQTSFFAILHDKLKWGDWGG